MQEGLVNPIRTAASIRNIAETTWLQVCGIPAMHVQWADRTLAVFFSMIIYSLCDVSFILSDLRHSPLKVQTLLFSLIALCYYLLQWLQPVSNIVTVSFTLSIV